MLVSSGPKGTQKEMQKSFFNGRVDDVSKGRESRSFVDVVVNRNKEVEQGEDCNLIFTAKEEKIQRLKKAFICEVHTPGSSFNMQTNFEMKG